ncbi:helix-turn-helix transcriptional regulator [Pseudonocardia sp. GCM10023141]|uniref:helix-turn-helix transcriptional regulator n=1 Tax=Pseudonocardia sp. GCM10023141 TaxID=3252653 RepID=UPI00361D5E13
MRSSRLLSVLLLLQTRRRLTARELATELDVSLRTIYRDVESLAAAGVPVYAEHGRGGGYRLVDGYRTSLTGLTDHETSALFMVGMPGPAAALGLQREAAAAELKLLAALPSTQRERAGRLRDRFHLDVPAWYRDAEPAPQLAALAEAVLHDRRVQVRYRRWAEPREVERTLEPHGLVLKNGAWYVVAASGGRLRTYRVSQILRLTPTDEQFARHPGFDLGRHWADHLAEFDARRITGTAVVRVSAALRARLPDLPSSALHQAVTAAAGTDAAPETDAALHTDAAGRLTVALPIESIGNAAAQLLPFAAEVEVLEPPQLRAQLAAIARSLLRLYGSDNGSDNGSDREVNPDPTPRPAG